MIDEWTDKDFLYFEFREMVDNGRVWIEPDIQEVPVELYEEEDRDLYREIEPPPQV